MLEHHYVKYQYWVIYYFNMHANLYIKMNEIVNKFLLAGDNFIPEMHLTQPRLLTVLVDNLRKTRKDFKI